MIETLRQGLVITGIGMGLVFIMIFLLWGIMALLVWLTNPREKAVKKSEAIVVEDVVEDHEAEAIAAVAAVAAGQKAVAEADEDVSQKLAAAIAVAFALKQPRPQNLLQEVNPSSQSSGWLSVGRAQQLLSRNRGRN